jgi:hypothetical protein
MATSAKLDRAALAATISGQEHVISRQQALGCGLTTDALVHRIRADGPWRRLLSGVYLAQTGTPTVPQREMAALLHGGPDSVLTGQAALHALGLAAAAQRFDVLVPTSRRPGSVAFVTIHRTSRMPQRVIREGIVNQNGWPGSAGSKPCNSSRRPRESTGSTRPARRGTTSGPATAAWYRPARVGTGPGIRPAWETMSRDRCPPRRGGSGKADTRPDV